MAPCPVRSNSLEYVVHTLSIRITQLIHENCAIILTFAFSQISLMKLREEKFKGEWKYFDKICFEIARSRADRAVLELAVHLRVLDDEQELNKYLRYTSNPEFGIWHKKDGSSEALHFRDATNKILHSSSFDWDFSKPDDPILVCQPTDDDRWRRAEINVVSLGTLCGELMS